MDKNKCRRSTCTTSFFPLADEAGCVQMYASIQFSETSAGTARQKTPQKNQKPIGVPPSKEMPKYCKRKKGFRFFLRADQYFFPVASEAAANQMGYSRRVQTHHLECLPETGMSQGQGTWKAKQYLANLHG